MENNLAAILIFGMYLFQFSDSFNKELYHFSRWLKLPEEQTGIYVFDWKLKVSIKQCKNACKSTKVCQYINYEGRTHLCALIRNDGKDTPVIEIKPGYTFWNKSEKIKNDVTESNHCDGKENCEMDDKQENPDKLPGCRKPEDAEIKGNMFTKGSKILQKCKNSSTKIPTIIQTDQTTCSGNGSWYPFTCLETVTHGGSYYHLQATTHNWHDAKAYCEGLFGRLLDINTIEEQWFIQELLLFPEKYPNGIWTGGNKEDRKWRWSDGSEISKFTHWGGNEGNGDNTENSCMAIRPLSLYLWFDEYCTSYRPCMCEFQ
ncbi:hypothetical protein ACF0H5_012813 [Mactra antiquata]